MVVRVTIMIFVLQNTDNMPSPKTTVRVVLATPHCFFSNTKHDVNLDWSWLDVLKLGWCSCLTHSNEPKSKVMANALHFKQRKGTFQGLCGMQTISLHTGYRVKLLVYSIVCRAYFGFIVALKLEFSFGSQFYLSWFFQGYSDFGFLS